MSDWYLDEKFWDTFYDLMFCPDHFAEAEAQAPKLLELAGVRPESVLDLGCGPGRHALPMARAGCRVTAVDASEFLLADLRRRADAAKLEIRTEQADMRSYRVTEAFDLVLLMWTSFGYFEAEADHRRVLDNIRAGLRPGGRLLLDLVGLEYLCRNLQPVHLTELDDGRILVERPVLTEAMTRLDNEWLLIEGDRVHRAAFSHRVWSAGEIRALLNAAGFEVIGIHGNIEGEDYALDSERMVVIAGL